MAARPPRRCGERRSTNTAKNSTSPRSSRCSTEPDDSSFLTISWTRWNCANGYGWRSSRTTSECGPTLTIPTAAREPLAAMRRSTSMGEVGRAAAPGETVLRGVRVSRTFGRGTTEVHACVDVDLDVHAGELLVVRGPSGAGKTTLLNMLGGLDRPTSGQVFLGDVELSALPEKDLVEIRRRDVGYVFQSFGLIPILSAAETIEIPL